MAPVSMYQKRATALFNFASLVFDFNVETGRFPGKYRERLQALVDRYQAAYGGELTERMMKHKPRKGVSVEQVKAAYQAIGALGMLTSEEEYMKPAEECGPEFTHKQQVEMLLGKIAEDRVVHDNKVRALEDKVEDMEATFTELEGKFDAVIQEASRKYDAVVVERDQLQKRVDDYNKLWWYQRIFTRP